MRYDPDYDDPWQEIRVVRRMTPLAALKEAIDALEQHAKDCFGYRCRDDDEFHLTWYDNDRDDYIRWLQLRAAAGMKVHEYINWGGIGLEVNAIADSEVQQREPSNKPGWNGTMLEEKK